ncbi:piezo-type mechanosensitive ion channel component 2-like protein [Labeo rohita]|uniref:Piezo-type mechanosensitive ion channel component 2-like protein n=1 Tax=Labeo rohita TaxID=84645 RepID=A0A498NQ47_LABRO|nr:piezo-type mechanosensitive ion channel component 2-like protein [Labeo rohita]
MIASYVKDNHRNWDKWLPEFRFAVNTAWQESIGFTPAEIALGRKLKGPLERALTRPPNPCDPTYDTVERHENLIQLVKENVQRAQAKQGHYYNLRRKQTLYKEGPSAGPLPGCPPADTTVLLDGSALLLSGSTECVLFVTAFTLP